MKLSDLPDDLREVTDRDALVELAKRDPVAFLYRRERTSRDVDHLLLALWVTDGLSQDDVAELQEEMFNVPIEYVPRS